MYSRPRDPMVLATECVKDPDPVPIGLVVRHIKNRLLSDPFPIRSVSLTSLNNTATGTYAEPSSNESNISKIEDLCSVRESKGPQFRGWTENMDEAFAVATGNFRTIGYTNKVGMFIRTEATFEFFSGCDGQRMDSFAGLE